MRRRSDQADHSLSASDVVTLRECMGNRLDGPLLLFGAGQFRVVARDADHPLAGGQPIYELAMIPAQRQLHVAIQFSDELRAQGVIHVEVPKSVALNPGDGRVVADDFSFPLGVEQIPPRFDFLSFRLLGIDRNVKTSMALKDKGVASFRIDEAMLSLKPFR